MSGRRRWAHPPEQAIMPGGMSGLRDAGRVLFLTDSLGGGTGRVMVDLLRGLRQRGWETAVATLDGRDQFLSELPTGVVPIVLRRDRSNWKIERFVVMARLLALVREQEIKILFSSLETANIYAAWLKRLRPRTRVVLGYHVNLSGYLRVARGESYRFFGLPMAWFVRRLYPWADAVVTPSEGAAQDLRTTFGLSAERTVTVPNPVDVAKIRSLAREPVCLPWSRREGPILSAAGTHRWIDTKGFDLLIKALARLKGSRAAKLILIGSGPQEDRVKRLVGELGLSGRVIFTGYVENPWAWMARSDLFVLSSRFETFGLVVVEAMAAGVPVLATNCRYGPSEIISHRKNGWLVPPEDPEALAKGIAELLAHPERRAEFARAGRSRSEDFAPERILPRYEALFRGLLER